MNKQERAAEQKLREKNFTAKVNTLSIKDINLKLALRGRSLFNRAALLSYSCHNRADGNRAERRRMLREACSRKSIAKAIRKEELIRAARQIGA